DCNDDNADVNPGAVEVCDERDVDEDCSGAADDDDPDVDVTTATTWYADGDDDGYGSDSDSGSPYCDDPSSTASAFVTDNTDCDDSRSSVNSGEDEVCDDADLDENCNG
ncbi:MAG TPA: hypothetical protein DFR83_01860, partial [Deltaproteobacteria bacterium]|nr:hypothetical protein [Deltaproteobacteria bacterium]